MPYKDPEKNREQRRKWSEAGRKWKIENPEKARESNRKSSLKQRKENPERVRAIDIASKSGLDKEVVYQYLLKRKDISVCDICQLETSGKSLDLDHNHETNEIRGLLCGNCNKALGGFKDSIKLLETAIEYLKGNKYDSD